MGYSSEDVKPYEVNQLDKTFYELGELEAPTDLTILEWINDWEEDFGMERSTAEYWETEGNMALSEHINFIEYLMTK